MRAASDAGGQRFLSIRRRRRHRRRRPISPSVFKTARLPLALTENAINVPAGKLFGENAVMPLQRGCRIHIKRRADFVGQTGEIDIFREKTPRAAWKNNSCA